MKKCYEPELADIVRYKPKVIFERIYSCLVRDEGLEHYKAIGYIKNMAFYKYCIYNEKIYENELPDWRAYLILIGQWISPRSHGVHGYAE